MAERPSPPVGWIAAFLIVFLALLGSRHLAGRAAAVKRALLAEIDKNRSAAPVPVETIRALPKPDVEGEYRRVTVTGRFDHAHEQYFFATLDGDVGYHVYTPLVRPVPCRLRQSRLRARSAERSAKRADGSGGRGDITGLYRAPLAAKPSWVTPETTRPTHLFLEGHPRYGGLAWRSG